MHYVSLALYAEGSTDYAFLRPLLFRLCEELCLREATQPVEIAEDVLALDHPPELREMPRAERIVAAAERAKGAWRILFVHADADTDAARARSERAQPAIDRLAEVFGAGSIAVAVVPIRMTEAWAIADGDALRLASGSTESDDDLGLPRTQAVESAQEPKAMLDNAWRIAIAARARQRKNVGSVLSQLGETVALSRLRGLSAFQALEQDLRLALRSLHVIP